MSLVTVTALHTAAPLRALRFGSRSCSVQCEMTDEAVAFAPGIPGSLGLRVGDQVNLVPLKNGQFRLGPLVGVMLGERIERLLTGAWRSRYRSMAREARAVGAIPFFFTPEDLDLEGTSVLGWMDRDGSWERVSLPLPDVIYDRASFQSRERRREVRRLLRQLRIYFGVSLINSVNAFAKSQVMEALNFYAETRDLAPETRPYTAAADLLTMLERHPSVFVKTEHGSHGSDVIRIQSDQSNWSVQGSFRSQQVDERFENRESLVSFLELIRQGTPAVIQQGITLPEVDSRLFDLRVILQKGADGTWQVPLVLVRLAQPEKVAANMSQGALPFLPDSFQRLFGLELSSRGDLEEMTAAEAVKVALALESRFGLLGEVGVDLGIGQDGRPWVFEANAKPLHPTLPDQPVPLTRYPFHYAVYLANRAWEGTQSALPPVREAT